MARTAAKHRSRALWHGEDFGREHAICSQEMRFPRREPFMDWLLRPKSLFSFIILNSLFRAFPISVRRVWQVGAMKGDNLAERLLRFAAQVLRTVKGAAREATARHVMLQLVRAASGSKRMGRHSNGIPYNGPTNGECTE